MSVATASTRPFEAPGPGGWRLLADHFPGAVTAEYRRVYAETCPAGSASYMTRYGVIARSLDVGYVHGHVYVSPAPLAGSRAPGLVTSALATDARPAAAVSPWMLVTGYDLDARASIELDRAPAPTVTTARQVPDLRPLVPSADHAELDALLADAKAAVELRDDNGAVIAAWPMGLLRRSMLAAGTRLFPADPGLAVEATTDELVALLAGSPSIDAHELEARRFQRAADSALHAPSTLGPEFALPPLDPLPGPLRRIAAAQLAAAEHMFTGERAVGVGTSSYTGRALVVDDPVDAVATLEPGDVVVTVATSPAWNIVLASAGALVTAHGGLVSHAAVIARELGIPAVVGDPSVCTRLRTGDVVTVDPVRATVVTTGAS